MSFFWSFSTIGGGIEGRLTCWPIEPGSVVITIQDGINDKTIVDDGDGTFSGDGHGTIDYDYGFIEIEPSTPYPVSGTDILADYTPVEGGCVDDCGRCATHYIKLDITPGTISGSDDFTLSDAWRRLFEKIRRDILPIHVEILHETFSESYLVSIGYRFDATPADEEVVDATGLRPLWDDTSW